MLPYPVSDRPGRLPGYTDPVLPVAVGGSTLEVAPPKATFCHRDEFTSRQSEGSGLEMMCQI